ncbi:MAG TPA: type II toxin-antitoxin system RelE/ParE family toxin [Candidatus Hydrogenedentes bacterium]|nr:type II toxin-antitoxin system RelE/ParE family toxin [Candidatus Hydrogenedentota bacterium]
MDTLSEEVFLRVKNAILTLETNPRGPQSKKLRGSDEYRLRIEPYRILYPIDDTKGVVEIMAVGRRREVYRGK